MTAGANTYQGDEATKKQQEGGTNTFKLQRNRAYLFIGLLLVAVISQALALAALMPLKTVVPAIATIDANGHVLKVQIVAPETITAHESVIHNELYEYVVNCNTIDANFRQRFSDLCHLHSTLEVAKQYDEEIAPDNPNNPYYLVGQNGKRNVIVTGISLLNNDTGQVTFKTEIIAPGAEPKTEYWTQILRFRFTGKPLALADRWENPLGFAVTATHKNQELSRK